MNGVWHTKPHLLPLIQRHPVITDFICVVILAIACIIVLLYSY